jgi:hypothetical protein
MTTTRQALHKTWPANVSGCANDSQKMTHGYLILFSLLLFHLSSYCQITFEKTLGFPEDQYGNDVIQTSDSCYMVIGGQYDSYYQWPIMDYLMFKVDREGNLIWARDYYGCWGDTWGNALVETQDHGFVSCGRYQESDACLVLCQPDGDSVWSREYEFGEGYGEASGICQMSDGRIAFTGVTAGYSDVAALFVCQANLSGQKLWFRKFPEPGEDDVRGTDILQADDGNLVVCGYAGNTSILLKISQYGDSLWMQHYTDMNIQLHSLKQTEDQGFIACGLAYDTISTNWDFFLMKTDSGGNMEWRRVFGEDNKTEVAYDVEITADKGYIFCGQSFSHINYKRDLVLIRTDQNGDTLWTRTFGSPDLNEEAYGMDCTSDGGFIITGYKQVNDTLNNVYLIKTDDYGNATWIWEAPGQAIHPLQIFPNPNDGIFIVDAADIREPGILEVRDANGRRFFHSQVSANQDHQVVNLQPCIPGIYFVALKTYSETYAAKLLVISYF